MDKQSATIDGYRPISLPVDHSAMNKFGSREEECFELVSSEIRKLIDWAPGFLRTAGQYLQSQSCTRGSTATDGDETMLIGARFAEVSMSRKRYFMVPYPQNDQFTAREGPYGQISRLMKAPEDKQVRIALKGLGGIGLVTLRRAGPGPLSILISWAQVLTCMRCENYS